MVRYTHHWESQNGREKDPGNFVLPRVFPLAIGMPDQFLVKFRRETHGPFRAQIPSVLHLDHPYPYLNVIDNLLYNTNQSIRMSYFVYEKVTGQGKKPGCSKELTSSEDLDLLTQRKEGMFECLCRSTVLGENLGIFEFP